MNVSQLTFRFSRASRQRLKGGERFLSSHSPNRSRGCAAPDICTTQWTTKTWHFIFDYNFG